MIVIRELNGLKYCSEMESFYVISTLLFCECSKELSMWSPIPLSLYVQRNGLAINKDVIVFINSHAAHSK